MYTKKSLRVNSKNDTEEIDQFLSSDFNQSDFNNFIENEVSREKDKKKVKNWWKEEDDSSETTSLQLGTGKNFMKPKIKPLEKEDIPEIVVQNEIESFSDSNVDLRLDLNKSSDPSQTIYNETIKENQSNRDTGPYQYPVTFEGITESVFNNKSESALVDTNGKMNKNKFGYEGETLKSNMSMLPIDISNDNFEVSGDYTKKEHLLSKVSLHDSYEDGKANRSSIRYEDFMSTGISEDPQDHYLEGTGYSYKTSINPASGDSMNTQGITNITDTVLGDNTAAEFADIHRQYEHITKESIEHTVNSNTRISDTVKEVAYDKSYPQEEISANNLESTINTKSFGMKVMRMNDLDHEREVPIPSPRKKSVSRSNENDFSNSDLTSAPHNRLSDNSEKKKTSRYSYVQSSGYGSKNITPPSKDNGSISKTVQERGRSKTKMDKTFSTKNKKEDTSRMKSNNRSHSRTISNLKDPKPVLNNDTYKIQRYSNEYSDFGNDNPRILQDKDLYNNPTNVGTEWHEKWLQERIMVKKLQVDSMTQENDFKKQIEILTTQYERKISHLESQLARAKDQLKSMPGLDSKVLGANVTVEDIERIKKDIKAHESIVSAYEKDNERLREEMKILKLKEKSENHIDSLENERLISQIASLKADLDSKEVEVRNLRLMARDNKTRRNEINSDFYTDEIAQLKSDLQIMNKKYLASESERQKVEIKLDRLAAETEKMSNQYHHEIHIEKVEKEKLQETHKVEVDDLKRKIKWYLENQVILDKESKKMKAKDDEIAELKHQLNMTGSMKISSNIRAKERTVDIARIKQLEEENMSLKEDLYALVKGKNIGNVASKRTVQFLEEKVKSLEENLENCANKENKSIRSLQQQFEVAKSQYEETIRDMELDATHVIDKRTESEKNTRIIDLKEKIDQLTKENQKKSSTINRLKVEMKTVMKDNQQNKSICDKNIRKIEPDSRYDSLRRELRNKDIDIQRLQIENDYLKGMDHKEASRCIPMPLELEAENARLKSQVAHLSFELNGHVRVIDEIKDVSLKNEHLIRDECREELRKCEEYHKEQLKNVKSDFVGRHSESELAALQSQVDVQKNYISHLQTQISDFTVKMRNYDAKNEELVEAKQQIQTLKSELFDLRLIWSNKPGLEMIDRLRSKVLQLEEKENLKGRQLDEYVEKVVKNNTKPFQDEVERWRAIVAQKNHNLLQVQNELSQLLEALEELRRQGISIPKFSGKIKLLPPDNAKHL